MAAALVVADCAFARPEQALWSNVEIVYFCQLPLDGVKIENCTAEKERAADSPKDVTTVVSMPSVASDLFDVTKQAIGQAWDVVVPSDRLSTDTETARK